MTSPRISLDQWRALVAVVDTGSYAKAADALHKSQSSVTYAVQQLESQLGVKAFRIDGRKAVLTPTGQMLQRRARYLLDEAGQLERSAQRLSAGWEAELRLAVEVLYPTWLLFDCLDRFGEESPTTRIELIESVLGHRTDALTKGRADLAIFGTIPARIPRRTTAAHALRPGRASEASPASARTQAVTARPASVSTFARARIKPRARICSVDGNDAELDR